jgi:hypothetical protein
VVGKRLREYLNTGRWWLLAEVVVVETTMAAAAAPAALLILGYSETQALHRYRLWWVREGMVG